MEVEAVAAAEREVDGHVETVEAEFDLDLVRCCMALDRDRGRPDSGVVVGEAELEELEERYRGHRYCC